MSTGKSLTPITPPAGVPTATLELHENLFWDNELEYSPVAQDGFHAVTGQFHVQSLSKLHGRSIVLTGGDRAKMTRADLRILQTWFSTPGLSLTLWWLGTSYRVVFQTDESGRCVESAPIWEWSDVSDDQLHHHLVLRFLTVPA